jgi:hypothetical protein
VSGELTAGGEGRMCPPRSAYCSADMAGEGGKNRRGVIWRKDQAGRDPVGAAYSTSCTESVYPSRASRQGRLEVNSDGGEKDKRIKGWKRVERM